MRYFKNNRKYTKQIKLFIQTYGLMEMFKKIFKID